MAGNIGNLAPVLTISPKTNSLSTMASTTSFGNSNYGLQAAVINGNVSAQFRKCVDIFLTDFD